MRLCVAALAAAALAGCAAAPTVPVTMPDPAVLSGLTQWTASGRIAIAAGEQGGSGGFTWRQDSGETRLSLRGPLGAGALEITTDGDALTLRDGSGEVLDATDARVQLETRLGAQLPLARLRYWMLGIPAPGAEARVTDSPVEPRRTIEQDGWQIRYEQLAVERSIVVPSRVTATSGTVRLRLIIDDWDVVSTSVVRP